VRFLGCAIRLAVHAVSPAACYVAGLILVAGSQLERRDPLLYRDRTGRGYAALGRDQAAARPFDDAEATGSAGSICS
jgi:hypothetical protein